MNMILYMIDSPSNLVQDIQTFIFFYTEDVWRAENQSLLFNLRLCFSLAPSTPEDSSASTSSLSLLDGYEIGSWISVAFHKKSKILPKVLKFSPKFSFL